MKSYNVEILTPEVNFYLETLEVVQDAYNFASAIMFQQENWRKLSGVDFHHLVYYKIREQFPTLKSALVMEIIKNVYGNYKSVRSNKHKISKPLEMSAPVIGLNKNLYSKLTKENFCLFNSSGYGRTKANFVLYDHISFLMSQYTFVVTQLFSRKGRLFVTLAFDIPDIPVVDESCLGIDRGIRRIVATSEGTVVKGTELQKKKRQIRYLKKKLQKKKTSSAKRHLRKLRKKEANFTKNYVHAVANLLLMTSASVLVLENLKGIKQRTSRFATGHKRTQHNRNFSQIPLAMLLSILTYKAPSLGKRVVTVSPKNTSKDDCTSLVNGKRVGCRYYCVDGRQLDSDVNAAVNIANRYSKHPDSSVPYPKELTYTGRVVSSTQSFRQLPLAA